MAKAVKLADIAAQLGVSTVTVSKALSGQKGVSEMMRKKIKELADEMGYKQPSTIRREKIQKSYNIGVLVSEKYLGEYDSFYWKMYQSMSTKAVQKGCFTLLEVISLDAEAKHILPKMVLEEIVDGLIIVGKLETEYLAALHSGTSIPMVYLDFYDERQMSDSVISNSYYGSYRLTNYLFDMGHENIAYVGSLLCSTSIMDRYFGYARSMMEHGRKVLEEWVIPDRDMEIGKVDVEIAYNSFACKPTAFVCNCDLTASKVIKQLNEQGIRVPEDVSVTGFDNYLYPGLCDVEITSYEVNVKEMSGKAVHILLRKIEDSRYQKGITIIDGRMVYKDSVKKKDK